MAGSYLHPYFGSLQRRNYNTPNIIEVGSHPYYGLPDVILLQNYGIVSDKMNDEQNSRERIENNEYHNALIEQEVKRRFSSLLSLGHERASIIHEELDNSREDNSSYYPYVNSSYRNLTVNFSNQNSINTLQDIGRYDQQTENFFGKRPDAMKNTLNQFKKRPDQLSTKLTPNSTAQMEINLDISEQFSDNFIGDPNISESTDNLFCASDDRADIDTLIKENRNNAQTGRAWVNFVNV